MLYFLPRSQPPSKLEFSGLETMRVAVSAIVAKLELLCRLGVFSLVWWDELALVVRKDAFAL